MGTEQCLLQRYRMYRFAAKKAKDSGNKATAIQYIKQSKLIKNCIEQIREGLVVWTSDIPPILDNELWNIASVQKQKIEEMDAIDFATDKSEIDVQIKSVFDKISSLSTQKQQSQHQSKQSIEIQNALNIEDKEATEQCLLQRYRMYRFAAKKAKDSGNKATAIQYIKQS